MPAWMRGSWRNFVFPQEIVVLPAFRAYLKGLVIAGLCRRSRNTTLIRSQ